MADRLQTLLRFRRSVVASAEVAFMEALDAAHQAEERVKAAKRSLQHEAEWAAQPHGSDATVEAFALWLPEGRAALDAAHVGEAAAAAEVARCRAELSLARIGAKVIERLMEERKNLRTFERRAKEQNDIDEISLNSKK
jgi:flagellar export protein FliJ